MLIKINNTSLTGVQKDKSEFWETSGYTPNEAYKQIPVYTDVVDQFARYNNIAGRKFFEVRVLREKPSTLFSATKTWWSHKGIMDRVFWVFQKPVYERVDGHIYTYYALEPNECLRIYDILGKPDGLDLSHAFIIPVECVDLVWNETANGVSEHIHYRPEVTKTQEQVDKEAWLDAEANKLLADIRDVDPLSGEFGDPRIVKGVSDGTKGA